MPDDTVHVHLWRQVNPLYRQRVHHCQARLTGSEIRITDVPDDRGVHHVGGLQVGDLLEFDGAMHVICSRQRDGAECRFTITRETADGR